jgi:hypothetical protein
MSKIINHYGRTIDSETPVTGVFSYNEILHLESLYDSIDPHLEEHIDECPMCESGMACDIAENWESYLELFPAAAWHLDSNGQWDFNPEAESSQFILRGNPCSPCYPGQVEFSRGGDFVAFSLPYDCLESVPFDRHTARWHIEDRIDNIRSWVRRHLVLPIKFIPLRIKRKIAENRSKSL